MYSKESLKQSLVACFPLPLLVLLAVYIAVRALFWRIYPVWDGMNGYFILFHAFDRPFDVLNPVLDGHIVQAFYWFMSLPLLLLERDYALYNVWLTVFSTVSIIAFYHLAALVAQRKLMAWETALCAALFALHPTILSNMLRFTFDPGVMTFLLLFWLALWNERRIAALLCAVMAMFSKETSYLLLPLPFAFCFLLQPGEARWRWLRQQMPVLLIPYALLAAFLFYKMELRHQPAFWAGHELKPSLISLLSLGSPGKMFPRFLAMIFMNFQWLLMGLWMALLAVAAGKRSPGLWKISLLLLLIFLGSVYAVTRVMPYTNPRYVMATVPILLLGFVSVLPLLPMAARVGLCAGLLVLLGMQDMRSVDPLPAAYFGTFAFGDHRMIDFHPDRDWILYGRDDLVYNLEFLKFPETVTRIVRDVRPGPYAVIVTRPEVSEWFLWPPVNRQYRPDFGQDGHYLPVMSVEQLMQLPHLPRKVYVPMFANCHCRGYFMPLEKLYRRKQQKLYNLDGYKTMVYRFSDPVTH